MNFRGRVFETKIIFFCILERVDGVNGEISMNPNDQYEGFVHLSS